tara:strand:- start:47639 stop:48283 length:645 start_codon:yes stop_codon:yes gene_type:complete
MDKIELQKLREDYSLSSLDESDVLQNPIEQFKQWIQEALKAGVPEPNAMNLATVDNEGRPHSRIVLLKGFDENGFVFFTNYASDKGREIEANHNVSICFFWIELERQVRIDGVAKKITKAESEAYFKSRPHKSQVGALASNQSEVVENRLFLEQKFEKLEAEFVEGEVPMPETWGGYVIEPSVIEFWQGRRSRLHDRIKYERKADNWIIKRLSP